MTEVEWLAGTDPVAMLDLFRHTRLDRRLRRFAVECCRRVGRLIDGDDFRAAAAAGEAFADDYRNERGMIRAMAAASLGGWRRLREVAATTEPRRLRAAEAAVATCASTDWAAAVRAARAAAAAMNPTPEWPDPAEAGHRAAVLRDIFGNPFRPVAFDPRWRTADAVGVARGIYEERAFDRLPLLADALMDAGCADEAVLGHCRRDGPHVRGCWVVDLVLGQE